MKPYGLISDTHHHSWSAFSSTLGTGVNSRLQVLLDETRRCAEMVKRAGGDTIIHAGDVFHVRGSVAPSVMNPTLDCYREIRSSGVKIVVLAGNHDLEHKEANRLGSAVTALEGAGCTVVNTASVGLRILERVIMIPWIAGIPELMTAIETARDSDHKPGEIDLIIHAPIDGVIMGIPNHGLNPAWLASMGFRNVFAGHYHHHKRFAGNVTSIGALAHHTWSDIGSKAGFLIVNDDGLIEEHMGHAPQFIELDASVDPDDYCLIVDGNYVRVSINSTKQKDVEDLRHYLTSLGALGVVVLSKKEEVAAVRAGSTVKSGASLEVSVNDYVKAQSFQYPEKVSVICQDILTSVRSINEH